MAILGQSAARLQLLLTDPAEQNGRACGLIQQRRQFSASSVLSTFVLGFLQHHRPTWEHLAFVVRQCGVCVSPQAVEQRVSVALRESLLWFWQAALNRLLGAGGRITPLLARFTHVLIGDAITISLTEALADEYPGCGA